MLKVARDLGTATVTDCSRFRGFYAISFYVSLCCDTHLSVRMKEVAELIVFFCGYTVNNQNVDIGALERYRVRLAAICLLVDLHVHSSYVLSQLTLYRLARRQPSAKPISRGL